MTTRKRRTTSRKVRSTKAARPHARRRSTTTKTKTTLKGHLAKKLKQARQAEIKALQKLNLIVRENQLALAKLRRTIKLKVAEKVRAATALRKKLAKLHQQRIAKLKRQHASAIAKLRKEFSKKHAKKKTQSKRKTKTSTTARRSTTRRTASKKVVPFRRVTSRSTLRRVA